MKLGEKYNKLTKYMTAVIFLAFEVLAFIAFSFGGSFLLAGILSFVLMVLLIIFSLREINIDGISNVAFLLFPLVLFTLLTATGIYSQQLAYLSLFSIGDLIFIPVGLLSIAVCGYLLSLHKLFKLKHFFVVVFSAIAILVFLNLLVTMINFGPLHTIFYKNYYMYFMGKRSDIPAQDMAYTLYGFKFIETTISHYYLYPALLLTSHFFLFKTSFKEEKKTFILYLSFSALALLALLLVPTWLTFVIIGMEALIDGIIFLYMKKEGSRKPLRITLYVFIGLGVIAYLVMLFNQQSAMSSFHEMIKGSALLNRIFNSNRFVIKMNPIIHDIFTQDKFFGYAGQIVGDRIILVDLSGSYLIDTYATSGVVGMLAFLILLVMAIRKFKKYFLNGDDELRHKIVLLFFVLIFFGYSLLFNDPEYGVFYEIYKPIHMQGIFFICLFIFGYVASKSGKPTEEVTKYEN